MTAKSPLRFLGGELHTVRLRTRMPFRYGIAVMTELPHALLRVWVELGGGEQVGYAADHLPPRWFTKDPDQPPDAEIAGMLAAIRQALATAEGMSADSVFNLWQALYAEQSAWARAQSVPPLLAHFGTALVERAVIDAACRSAGRPFHQMLRSGALGVRLGAIRNGLDDADLRRLPDRPLDSILARHTVGLGDPLTDADIAPGDRLGDGLPQSLADCIARYGLRHFKIKLGGQVEADLDRLARSADVISTGTGGRFAFSLDGNENYRAVESFREFWERARGRPRLADFLARLLFVEQPLHRDVALSDEIGRELRAWTDRPPILIDESDGAISDAHRAMRLGYVGTSHKNCKGVFKGIANACLIAQRRRADPHGHYAFSGEDLSNVGPVALLQDLAVAATLGLNHVERNGHHYFAGLGALPDAVQAQVLSGHGDLYHRHEAAGRAFPTLSVRAGAIELGSVLDAPFGYGFEFNPGMFQSLEQWRFESLGLAPPSPAPRSLQEAAPL
jgi:L-alanine-DL-glutamate epimerase-like enolase superfamily enzyme